MAIRESSLDDFEEVLSLRKNGATYKEINEKTGRSLGTIVRWLRSLPENNKITEKNQKKTRSNIFKYGDGNRHNDPYKKKKLVELRGHQCERCGRKNWVQNKIPLELHHIDRDHFNNNLDNLMLLCSNCHKIEHKEIPW